MINQELHLFNNRIDASAMKPLSHYVRRMQQVSKAHLAVMAIKRRWSQQGSADQALHGLNSELIISLTSYPARFDTLALTLKCILSQTVGPDRVVLWIARDDAKKLPIEVVALLASGLTIELTDDTLSYKKIVPALHRWPNAVIVTADDDVYYEPTWLSTLLQHWDQSPSQIVCRRAHRFTVSEGRLASYRDWKKCITGDADPRLIFPTGVGGVLYPPGSLASTVKDRSEFTRLCPHSDDIWLYWMGRLAGSTYKVTPSKWEDISWPKSQKTSLYQSNEKGRNDRQLQAIWEAYGSPL